MGNCFGKKDKKTNLLSDHKVYCSTCMTFMSEKNFDKHRIKCLKNNLKTPTIYDINMDRIQNLI